MKAAVLMGSKSDLPVLETCIGTLKAFGVSVDAHVISAHRTPDAAREYASRAEENGIEVIIAAAGKAAHLAGVIAAYTTLPVIGIPIKSSTMDGLDSLLSTVQMPPGIPVATVAINGAENAALLAVQILSLKYPKLKQKLADYKKRLAEKVIEADKNLQKEIAL
ncbi:MAG: 5-(carboxyamino)imidazole ribonucleotide mutase [Burkholderiales bacterium]